MNYFFRCVFVLLILSAINVHSQPFKSEANYKEYFTQHAASLDPIEGLWKVTTSQESYNFDTLYNNKSFTQTVAVLMQDSVYHSYDMKGGSYNVSFTKTSANKVYLYRILLKEVGRYTKANAVISAGRTMECEYELPEDYLQLVFKDTFEKGDRVVNKVKWLKIFPL